MDINDVEMFANAIIRSYEDVTLYTKMCNRVRSLRLNTKLMWKDIVMKYVQSYING